jgi:DNA-binding MltR family transcriptional regulator
MAYWFLSADVSMDAILELNSETARATAVVGAAITDAILTESLLRQFPRAGRTRDELFKSAGGRLGDYDTKSKLAYTLGIVSKQAFEDIQAIGEIRNKFAHRLDISSFDHKSIVSLCDNLKLVDTVVGRLDDPSSQRRFVEPDLEQKLSNPKSRFILSIKIITAALVNTEKVSQPDLRELI